MLAPHALLALGGMIWTVFQVAECREAHVWVGLMSLYCTVSLAFLEVTVSLAAAVPPCTAVVAERGVDGAQDNTLGSAAVVLTVDTGVPAGQPRGGSKSAGAADCGSPRSSPSGMGACYSTSGYSSVGCSELMGLEPSRTSGARRWRPLFKDPTFGGTCPTTEQLQASLPEAERQAKMSTQEHAQSRQAWGETKESQDTAPPSCSIIAFVSEANSSFSPTKAQPDGNYVMELPGSCQEDGADSESGLSAGSSARGGAPQAFSRASSGAMSDVSEDEVNPAAKAPFQTSVVPSAPVVYVSSGSGQADGGFLKRLASRSSTASAFSDVSKEEEKKMMTKNRTLNFLSLPQAAVKAQAKAPGAKRRSESPDSGAMSDVST